MKRNEYMINAVKDALKEYDINEYVIIRHYVRQYYIFSEFGLISRKNHTIESYHIYFVYSEGTAYIRLPTCSKDVIKSIIARYISNHFFYMSNKMKFNAKNKHVGADSSASPQILNKFSVFANKYLKRFAYVTTVMSCDIAFYSHEKVFHSVDIIYPKSSYSKINVNMYSVMRIIAEDGGISEWISTSPFTGQELEKIQKALVNNCLSANDDINSAELSGKFVFSPDQFVGLLHQLMGCLNGETIATGRSFVSKSAFNSKILNENISVIFNPDIVNDGFIDDEGSMIQKRYIIKKGVLVSCCNNTRSASLLGQPAGNARYDYLRDTIVIATDNMKLLCGKRMQKDSSMSFVQNIETDSLGANYENGILFFSFTAKRKDAKHFLYSVKMPIFDFFNKIIGSYGKTENINNYILSGAVLEF